MRRLGGTVLISTNLRCVGSPKLLSLKLWWHHDEMVKLDVI